MGGWVGGWRLPTFVIESNLGEGKSPHNPRVVAPFRRSDVLVDLGGGQERVDDIALGRWVGGWVGGWVG